MTTDANQQIVIAELPTNKLGTEHFSIQTTPIPQPGAGEVLCKTLYLSLDAANRAWMQGATYRSAITAGTVMSGGVLAEVVVSNTPEFSPGDLVEADGGWQQYFVANSKVLRKRIRRDPLSHLVSVLGVTGKTAYCGLLDIGQPQAGETVVVSAAAGATGNVVGQIAKLKGARVVGIAGGEEKCDWLQAELDFDATVDYRRDDFHRGLKEACPNGIDVYFDSVGGAVLEAVLFRMNMHGRVICCGAVSQYDTGSPEPGPRGVPGLIVTKRLSLRGFIVMDYYGGLAEQAEQDLNTWVQNGNIKVVEDIIEGLDAAPEALIGLLGGQNYGKRMIRVDPTAR